MPDTREPIARLPVFGWQALAGAREAALPCLLDLPSLHYTTSGRDSILLALEALGAIDAALDGLAPPVREAFLLAQLEGLSYAEIAARLEVSASSVKQYLTRANRQCFFALAA